ncbi:MAG: hypothetical protein ABRQ39_16250 [Candidatus Eremiobacterota bacterium]
MFFKQILSFFLFLLFFLVVSIDAYGKITWNIYSNARFGYDIEYPDILVPQEEAQNGDGRRFVSSDEKSVLIVYGAVDVLDTSVERMYTSAIDEYKKGGKKILYRVIDKNWFVLSGYDGDKVFYRKTMRQHQLEDDIDIDITFILTYPKSQKSTFDKITERISGSFCFK